MTRPAWRLGLLVAIFTAAVAVSACGGGDVAPIVPAAAVVPVPAPVLVPTLPTGSISAATSGLAAGGAYSVTVSNQPTRQTCNLNSATGSVASGGLASVVLVAAWQRCQPASGS